MKFTGKVKVWLTNGYTTYEDFERLYAEGKFDELASGFHYTNLDMCGQEHWTFVGTSEITVDLISKEQIVEGKIESMRAEIQTIKAVAQRSVEILEEQIQSMLALPNPSQTQEDDNNTFTVQGGDDDSLFF